MKMNSITNIADVPLKKNSPLFWLTLLVPALIIPLGINFLLNPIGATAGFGIPITDPSAFPYMWTKGVRDIFSGVVVLLLFFLGDIPRATPTHASGRFCLSNKKVFVSGVFPVLRPTTRISNLFAPCIFLGLRRRQTSTARQAPPPALQQIAPYGVARDAEALGRRALILVYRSLLFGTCVRLDNPTFRRSRVWFSCCGSFVFSLAFCLYRFHPHRRRSLRPVSP